MKLSLDTDLDTIMQISEPITVKDVPYWTSEYYGFGKQIRKYGWYPKRLPLLIFTDHSGPHVIDRLSHFEVNTTASVVMFHSPYLVAKWKSLYSKLCYNLYSPFVFFRRQNRIEKTPEAVGTIAYPAHTIPELDDVSNIENYITDLKNLPDKYQPVDICLHYHDVNKGLHKLFIDRGFKVYTAGNPADYKFVDRFYAILRNYKYSTSNLIGSYLFYSVEMGIPFFLHGPEPMYAKNSDSLVAVESLDSINTKDDILNHYESLFSGLTDKISPAQEIAVAHGLGLKNGITRVKMSIILYKTYFAYKRREVLRFWLNYFEFKFRSFRNHSKR